jgi:hypothetical protein
MHIQTIRLADGGSNSRHSSTKKCIQQEIDKRGTKKIDTKAKALTLFFKIKDKTLKSDPVASSFHIKLVGILPSTFSFKLSTFYREVKYRVVA